MIQDKAGFMWFGTQDGLNRYDGYDFKIYKHDPLDPESISDDFINQLFLDRDGVLWMVTGGGGLNRYDAVRETFTRFESDPGNPASLANNRGWAIGQDDQGRIWVGTDGGLSRMDGEENRFTHFLLAGTAVVDGRPEGSATVQVSAILSGRDGFLWVGGNSGLHRLDPRTSSFRHYDDGRFPGPVTAILEDHQDRFWVGTLNGLCLFDRETESLKLFRHDPDDLHSLPDDFVRSLAEDRAGDIWIGVNHGGLALFDAVNDRFHTYANDPDTDSGLSGSEVSSIHEDRGGVLWVGTYAGLNRVNRRKARFKHYKYEPGNPFSLSDNAVWSMILDRSGLLWVGTHEGGLNRYSQLMERFRHYRHNPKDPSSISSDRVFQIREDANGDLWLGTAGGLNKLIREDERFIQLPFNDEDPFERRNHIRALYLDDDGMVWIGAQENGLFRLDPKTGATRAYRNVPGDPQSLVENRVRFITSDTNGDFWLGTGGGVNRFNPKTEKFVQYRHEQGNPNSLNENRVLWVMEGQPGVIWIGTFGGGINKLVPATNTFSHYGVKEGLPNDSVNALLIDNDGFIWASTNGGLSKFDPVAETFKNYTSQDGLQSNEFNGSSAYKAADGELFFGGINGFNSFYPRDIRDNPHRPPVVLTSFKKANEPALLPRSITETRHIDLSYHDAIFSFEFAALDFAGPSRNSYAYQMKGFQPGWIQLGHKRDVTFTNLDPGNYTFRVKASNNDGLWNEIPRELTLTIVPPPWRTWWAYSIYALLVLAIVAGYIHSQRAKLRAERLVVERLKKVDRLKDEFLANTSHELRTPLNGIIGLAESLLDGAAGTVTEKQAYNLAMIASSGRRLAGLVNDILDFSKLKNRGLDLELKPVDLVALTDVVLTLSRPLVGKKELHLLNSVAPGTPAVLADENRLQQIMHNLVGNAVKFTESGVVEVSAEVKSNHVLVRVSDTGIGIAEANLERIFESFEQADGSTGRTHGGTGLGLAVTRQLLRLHGGEIWAESVEGEGASFCFTVPLADEPADDMPSGEHLVSRLQSFDQVEDPFPMGSPALSGRYNILVVDDEPINRLVLVNHLSLADYNITQVSSGPEALYEIENSEPFDLILLDIMMPKMSGYEVCRKVRQRHPVHELPVIFLSAKDQVSDLVTGFSSGANDYLTKPISKNELLSRVRTHLQLKDINRTLEQKVYERTKELKQRNDELETLDGIVKTINSEITLQRVLQTMLNQGKIFFPQAEKGAFLIWDPHHKHFRCAAAVGYNLDHLSKLTFTMDELVARYMESNEQVEKDIYLVRSFKKTATSEKLADIPIPKSMLSMAMRIDGRIQGFLVLDNFTDSEAFDRSDGRKLDRFRAHAVSAVEKARFLQELKDKNEAILQTQNQLIVQEKMASLGTLAAGIAHEIKNPLNFVNNLSAIAAELMHELKDEIAKLQAQLPAEAMEDVFAIMEDLRQNTGVINDHGKRANRIVQSMMNLARGEKGERMPAKLNMLVDESSNLALSGKQSQHGAVAVEVAKDFDSAIDEIPIIPPDLGRVIINLVNNGFDAVVAHAAEAGADYQPALHISTHDAGERVLIKVRDNGVGISESDRANIFHPFFTTKMTDDGNIGLGLFISYDIVVQEHHGELTVDSVPGQFTEFVIALPKV